MDPDSTSAGADNTAQKQRGRPFEPGTSGNPAGRPKGARNKAAVAMEALLDGEAEAAPEVLGSDAVSPLSSLPHAAAVTATSASPAMAAGIRVMPPVCLVFPTRCRRRPTRAGSVASGRWRHDEPVLSRNEFVKVVTHGAVVDLGSGRHTAGASPSNLGGTPS